jgi:hypothetical protein
MKCIKVLLFSVVIFQFVFPRITNSAEFSRNENNSKVEILINGTIESGDFKKFLDEVLRAFAYSIAYFEATVSNNNNQKVKEQFFSKYGAVNGVADITVILNSNGGDSVEAMKIGEAIRDMALKTEISERDGKESVCLSSCFFIWAAGVDRSVTQKDKSKSIGIHRVYYNQEYYKNLSSSEAEEQYNKARFSTETFLESMKIPKRISEKIFTVPSNQIYWLTNEDIQSIEGEAPYFEELLLSKCGGYTETEKEDYLACGIIQYGMEDGNYNYLPKKVKEEISLKCKNMSPGYLSYLEKKYKETRICQTTNGNIERWKRIKNYLAFFFPNIKNIKLNN